ncbi:LysM peptidoglycan-binding domain-containing protein [Hymenobacter jejuensis]|uniref:LysM peptidoglycan-binding domain-containing protein n=1 Tax=Hymenobacter jejuensis TaxID=2502781 RepID=A0A5B8A515_9BACT|nr:LysM peptidoglycan-binding domain-containing protein [Hymenobacter jejuensis]QDA61675.1 LysM peptidoglycan-binding domain-containing protein [Hymenobacter jejuensis]
MTRFSLLFAAFVVSSLSASAALRPVLPDSIGVEYRNNKMLIKHRVNPGETLYGLSRRYKVPVDQIVEVNPNLQGGLNTGQIVLVPRSRVVLTNPPAARPAEATSAPTSAAARALATDAHGNKVYKVEKGQTLFSIARRFETTPDALAQLNHLPAGGGVRIGQLLVIVPAHAAPSAPPTPTQPQPQPVVATTPVKTSPPATAPTTPANRPERAEEAEKSRETAPPTTSESTTDEDRAPERASEIVRRVKESGLAAVIEGGGTDKYLALHKTAPVGTIMQVRNIMNGQAVYVRVIGQLPDTGENSNILVRLSKKAVQRLSTPDSRFRVETSYVP